MTQPDIPLYLVTLGSPHLVRHDMLVRMNAYEIAVLAALGIDPAACSRNYLAELLWGTYDTAAKHRLRQLLYALRRKLQTDPLAAIKNGVLVVDAQLCMSAAKRGEASDAIKLHAGLFLSTLPPLSSQFSDWRDYHSSILLGVVRTCAHAALLRRVDHELTIELTAWLNQYDQVTSNEHVAHVRSLLALGRTAEASLAIVAAQDSGLDRQSDLEVVHLAEQLSQEQKTAPVMPLVGRSTHQAYLSDNLRAGAGTRIAMIVGPAGIGKSKLLDWAARCAAVRGALVQHSQIGPLGATAPPLSSARRLFGQHSQYTKAFAPQVAGTVPNLSQCATRLAASWHQAWKVLAVDNINFADAASRRLLELLATQCTDADVQLVCATSGNTPNDVLEWAQSLDAACDVISLEPLPDEPVRELLDAALSANSEALDTSTRFDVMKHGAGNPRRLLQLVELRAERPSADDEWISSSIEEAARVIRNMSATERGIVQALLACGLPTSESLLRAACMEVDAFQADISKLVEKRILRRTEGALDFRNELVQRAAGILLPHAASRFVRARLAGIFADLGDYGRAAEFACASGDHRRAAALHRQAAEQALSVGAYLTAERQIQSAFKNARTSHEFQITSRIAAGLYIQLGRWSDAMPHLLALIDTTPDERMGVTLGRLVASNHLDSEDWRQAVGEIRAAAAAGANHVQVCRGYLEAIDRAYHSGNEEIPIAAFLAFIKGLDTSDPCAHAEILTKAARINILFSNSSEAPQQAEAAVVAAEQCGDPVILQNSYNTRAVVRLMLGQFDLALEDFARCNAIANTADLVHLRDRFTNNMALLYYESGDLRQARRLLVSALRLNRHVSTYALANLAVIELESGQRDACTNYCNRLIAGPAETGVIIGLSVKGLQALTESRPEAEWCRNELLSRLHGDHIPVTDPSYTAIFLARMMRQSFEAEALLAKYVSRMAGRNVYSELRLRLELATMAVALRHPNAAELCHEIETRASAVRAEHTRRAATALRQRASS